MRNQFCILSIVKQLKTCGKTWSLYEKKSDTSVHMLLQQWYSYQKEPDIATHIVKLENLAHRLQTLGEKIPNQMIISKILMTLPSSFKYFISAWESTQPSERTLTNLISRLRKQGQKSKKEQRILLLLPISNIINIIIIIINIRKISKKATLDQYVIIAIIQDIIGSRNVESEKQQHQMKNTQKRKEKHLLEQCLQNII